MLSDQTAKVLQRTVSALRRTTTVVGNEPLRCGVDLGTASIIEVVLGPGDRPLACEMEPCQVARDGLVVDYLGAVEIVKRLTDRLRKRLGTDITSAAIAVPPGTSTANSNTHRYIVEAANLEVVNVLDEPTAANSVLGLRDGAVVDIGGGTTGLSVFEDGKVVYEADEPTGGTHMNLVLMGRYGLTFEQSESFKLHPANADAVRQAVRPVMEKMATIVARHLDGRAVSEVWLVGGPVAQDGIEAIFADVLGVPVFKPPHPMMVTPLGIAMNAGRNIDKEVEPC